MKSLITIIFILITFLSFGQDIKDLKPDIGYLVDKSIVGEIEFIQEREKCEEIWKKVGNQIDYKDLSENDKYIYDNCSEEYEDYWDILGVGCSWYCGGGQDTLSASSELITYKKITYSAENAHDLSYKTAWIEGVSGYGIGEYLTCHIPPQNPRITKIIIVNGYVKSEKAWKENSRVKKLKMYINDKPFAILNLQDVRNEQTFSFDPIGISERTDWKELQKMPWWTMKFEILEVYKGEKFDETAITEIYFDGIDVHCFGAGTKVTMADNSTKSIESVVVNDWVLTFNEKSDSLIKSQVSNVIQVQHSNLLKLKFSDATITVTDDHPFWTSNNNWASVNALKANNNYIQNKKVIQLKVGDKVWNPLENKFFELLKIEHVEGEHLTYTIELDKGGSFIANGLLAKTEQLKTSANTVYSK